MSGTSSYPTSAHWGSYRVVVEDGRVVGTLPDPDDPAPSPVIANTPAAQHHASRVARPAVRRRWLENGPGPDPLRGDPDDAYVEVEWSTALDLLAGELDRVRGAYGNAAIYGGSYGWGSAGRIHHAQSQLHRFLNVIGGYTRSRTTYSHGAVEVLFPRIIGVPAANRLLHRAPSWTRIREHTELLVSFGGLRVSNTWTSSGGRAAQTAGPAMRDASGAGVEFVSVSPLLDDTPEDVKAEWVSLNPGTDTAVMLALMHVLFTEGLADTAFLDRYTVGADVLRAYVLGERDERGGPDGTARTPEWAERISGVSADELRSLARRMAARRTLVNVGWSVQRARYGEQPLWAGLALACCLGQVGLPGGGFASGYGSMGNYGGGATPLGLPRMPQGNNAVDSFIPVARVADMLLEPGGRYDHDGEERRYPDIRLVYWAGGNPFHHHQDLRRLTEAFGRPETVVVNETHWTATARHADIVLPATTVLERDDMAASQGDLSVRAMPRAVAPHGQARDEYDTYADLAERLGVREEFTEGRTSGEWMRVVYGRWRSLVARRGLEVPEFEEFWERGRVEMPGRVEDEALLGEFRADPEGHALRTPSGRIELFSETIASFGYEDCPGHPVWLAGPVVTGSGAQAGLGAGAGESVATDSVPGARGSVVAGSGTHAGAGEPEATASGAGARGSVVAGCGVGAPVVDGSGGRSGEFPLVLIANQPSGRLHSQQDMGAHSMSQKVRGRAPLRMRPEEAQACGVADGDVVRVSSATGSCLAGVVVSDALRPGVVQLSTGAWYDPSSEDVTCAHGNPNALTEDVGTSSLSQGCTGQLVRVRVEPFTGEVPPVRAFEPPRGVTAV
ncbi:MULTISPECIES: molybdopterin-dependent oxidoreductase [Nocardiopsis]|uniref:Molybdopterin oxidoreductase n=1 Tax=Nocardiopsis dassonvillei (strain ATCC 23218 / DSM 43111 / CIP 107115 / JCM 7437 / KCTC 9190 / NBRC 14626 / NCTC 10488 / NRRL B-5397 / IMRU 509) TaxID=446468 RepID=D7B8R6_NOCDD|nr:MULTISPECIES: molybdopterin-dependent oxidoreductase [Nocardiopsis]ADH70574.1 molybdopterin oxidoreductase [Nocardiopsis dassonvillei subsp. dassonvillei DSM 43111]APC33835.1 molybdopterin oxidoreductase [Nocardiopsis dassonvillei]NKY81434.1 molybdopterin-dependent oxidoreductase [Nocardiopsis dassonvillei]VEI91483.1 Dimethyl sulfoxide/trimethylamine N-oxide reductase precursor [Nocardiopsis dassonvillei]